MLVASRHAAARRGAVILSWLIVFGLVVIAVLYFSQRIALQRHLQVELQVAADATAHAGAAALANDHVLTDDPHARPKMMGASRHAAGRLAALNRVSGKPVALRDNPRNLTDGEIVLGGLNLAVPREQAFDVSPRAVLSLYEPDLNAARVTLRRGGAAASALALADHDVVGFRVREGLLNPPSSYRPPAIPLMPIAIASEPGEGEPFGPESWAKRSPDCWEKQILARAGGDRWRRSGGTWEHAQTGDGIPEIDVVISEGGEKGNGRVVRFDPNLPAETTLAQAKRGVTFADLKARGGQLRLNDGASARNELPLPPLGPTAADVEQLAETLAGMVGQPRVWLLYSGVRENSSSGEQAVVVVGFVAARVVAVRSEEKVGAVPGGKALTYRKLTATLQPCVMNVPTAVTNCALRDLPPRPLYNPYLARVRVVE